MMSLALLTAFQRATFEDLRGLYPWFEPPDVVEKLRKAIASDAARAILDGDTSGGGS
jgi:hypothetical protein